MKAHNSIEPVVSPWASNDVLVKKDGSLWLCVDYILYIYYDIVHEAQKVKYKM